MSADETAQITLKAEHSRVEFVHHQPKLNKRFLLFPFFLLY